MQAIEYSSVRLFINFFKTIKENTQCVVYHHPSSRFEPSRVTPGTHFAHGLARNPHEVYPIPVNIRMCTYARGTARYEWVLSP